MPVVKHFLETSRTQSLIIFIFLQIVPMIFSTIYNNLIVFLIITWVTKLNDLFTSNKAIQNMNMAKHILNLYVNVENGFGGYFFGVLSVFQLIWITFLFLAFSTAANGLNNGSPVFIFLGFLTLVFATLLEIIAFVFCLDSCHKSLRVFSTELQADVLEMLPGIEKKKAQCLVLVKLFSISLAYKL